MHKDATGGRESGAVAPMTMASKPRGRTAGAVQLQACAAARPSFRMLFTLPPASVPWAR
jgi:hypothetical protein